MKKHINAFVLALAVVAYPATMLYGLGLKDTYAAAEVEAAVQQSTAQVMDEYAQEVLTVTSGAAVPITATLVSPTNEPSAKMATVTVETADIRIGIQTTPTTTVGQPKKAGATFLVYGVNNVRRLKFIAQSTTATVTVTLYR